MLTKQLPAGDWLTIKSLPMEITEEQVQEWMSLCGVELPLDNILVVKNHHRFAQAIVCLERAHVADLFRRATLSNKFCGQTADVTFKEAARR